MSTDTAPAARPRWHWSYIDDIGWISPEEAAAVDPWGDNPTGSAATPIDDEKPPNIQSTAELDPWGDNPTGAEPSTTGGKPSDRPGTADFDPWADSA